MSLPQLPTSIKGVALALGTQHPKAEDRIVKAVDLISRGRIKWVALDDQGEPIYECISSDGSMTYVIHAGACTCPARKLCYHRISRGILTILAANKTAVAFREALALEDEEPTTPAASTEPAPAHLNECGEHAVFVAPVADELRQCGEHRAFTPAVPLPRRVQSAGSIARGLTIRHSMDKLGKLISEAWVSGPFVIKA